MALLFSAWAKVLDEPVAPCFPICHLDPQGLKGRLQRSGLKRTKAPWPSTCLL